MYTLKSTANIWEAFQNQYLFISFNQCYGSILWFGLLYWEGIIQMEYNTFGPVFVCAHLFFTTWSFVAINVDTPFALYLFKRLSVYTKAFDDDVAYIKNYLLNDPGSHGGGKAQLSPMFGNQAIQMSIMKAYIKLKLEIKNAERVCGLMQAITIVTTALIYVTVSISIATQDYSKKPFVPIYGFMYVNEINVIFKFSLAYLHLSGN